MLENFKKYSFDVAQLRSSMDKLDLRNIGSDLPSFLPQKSQNPYLHAPVPVSREEKEARKR